MRSDRNHGSSSLTASDTASQEQPLPARVGTRYDVLSRLGRGGSSVVYRVRDRSHPSAEFALKQLTLSGSQHDEQTRALFEREYHVLAQLKHPNAVQVHDFGIDAAGPYYTMELLDGGDLSTHAPLPPSAACSILTRACSLLSLLHARGFVHRDVTPRNVRLTADATPKLIDFGAMVPFGAGAHPIGTPGFVAPEVVHRMQLDARTDLFSVGATLYYALTGQRPYAARTFAELNEVWRNEPIPAGELVSGIPAALDALIAALLQIDPARRPHNAFEVMQRLAAMSGEPIADSAETARAYLTSPMLVGREHEQRKFRLCLRRATRGEPGAVMLQGSTGSGRSRLLDACLLEAKTNGAIVLRADGRALRAEAFACAQLLADQLLEARPDETQPADFTKTFAAANGLTPSLPRPGDDTVDAPVAWGAWLEWVTKICRKQPLVIALDDAERIDAASLGLVASLIGMAASAISQQDQPQDANSCTRLLVIATTLNTFSGPTEPALSVLAAYGTRLSLEPLAFEETEALFGSIFAGAPHVALLSDRIHKLANGYPRATLALAHYMLDAGLIRLTEGTWILPAELALSDLPASIEDALRARLAALPPLARRLAETQSLALEGPWTRDDYHVLASHDPEQLDEALRMLLRQGVIVENASRYTLAHHGVRACLNSQLDSARRAEYERALAAWCARTGRPAIIEAYYALLGDSGEPALDRLQEVVLSIPNTADGYRQLGVDPSIVVTALERAHALSIACRRRPYETYELARRLIVLSLLTDDAPYHRYAPAFVERLKQDSGFAAFHASSRATGSARLQRAMAITAEQHASQPETQRVYAIEQAIKHLAHHVLVATVIGTRAQDVRLLNTLPELLEPFAELSAQLHAMWQTATYVMEIHGKAQLEQARERAIAVHRSLANMSAEQVSFRDSLRHAIALGIASLEVELGYASAEAWIAISEAHALQHTAALRTRRRLCMYDGDLAGAELLRRRIELLIARAGVSEMFDQPHARDLFLHLDLNDLAKVKQLADRSAQAAERWPGWQPNHELAQGVFHRMRGDLVAARAAFERALALANPDRVDASAPPRIWVLAAQGCVGVLAELGQLEAARTLGLAAEERCHALAITGFPSLTRELALVEAQIGDHAQAAARLDALIAAHVDRRPSLRALDFEARARVAIIAKDSTAAAHFAELALQTFPAIDAASHLIRRSRLLDEAKLAGLELNTPRSAIEAVLLEHTSRRAIPEAQRLQLEAALGSIRDAPARARRALELLSHAHGAAAGALYYAHAAGLTRSATLGQPDPTLDRYAAAYWKQLQQQAAMTTIFTAQDRDASLMACGTWHSPSKVTYCLLPLSTAGEAQAVGLAVLQSESRTATHEYWSLSACICARLLDLGDASNPNRMGRRR